jgi:hypothetical protein
MPESALTEYRSGFNSFYGRCAYERKSSADILG